MTAPPISRLLGATALLVALAGAAPAESIFTPSADGFVGQVRASAAEPGQPIHKGSAAVIAGERLVPGQKITLMRGPKVLNVGGPLTVDGKGAFSFPLTVDAEAATGLHPVVVIAESPAAATVIDLKVSPLLPVSGAEGFSILNQPVTRGLYQVAFSPASDALFVTAAVGRPPVKDSALLRIDPETLAVEARATPAAAPARPDGSDGGVLAVYGVAVDDRHGNVWVTNTRQNTVAVYRQSDLSLVHQFAPGAVNHSRDVVIDADRGRAYVSAAFTGDIAVFDTGTLKQLDPIAIGSGKRGEEFSTMSLDLAGGRLVTVSMRTDEAAVIDLAGNGLRVFDLPGARGASGVAYDPKEDLLFVASQQSDNLLIVRAATGEVLHDVEVGAGALSVSFDAVHRLAYVANRAAGTVTVVDPEGRIVANLDGGTLPNQVKSDGRGNVFAVNKSRDEDDPEGDRIWRIAPASQ